MLKYSTFGKLLQSNKLNFPEPRFLLVVQRGVSLPFVLVGDEEFILSGHVLRLYPPPHTHTHTHIQIKGFETYLYIQAVTSTKDSGIIFCNIG